MDSKPGGRKIVWLLVAASVALLLVIFIARPMQSGREGSPPVNAPAADQAMVGPGATQAEMDASTVPGAADETRPARP